MLVLIWEIQMMDIIQMKKIIAVKFNILNHLLRWIMTKCLKSYQVVF